MTRPRFSLRGLLLLTAVVAVACWWHDRPRRVASEFAAEIEDGDYQAAERLIGEEGLLTERLGHPAAWEIGERRQSMRDWFWGEYHLEVTAITGTGGTRLAILSLVANGSNIRRSTDYALLSRPRNAPAASAISPSRAKTTK